MQRIYVEANSLPVPMDFNQRRCVKKLQGCALLTGQLPNGNNIGCKYCNDIRLLWETRGYLLSKLNDTQVSSIKDFFDFETGFPTEYKDFIIYCQQHLSHRQPEEIFSNVKTFGSYENQTTEPVRVSDNGTVIESGNHRIRVAQILDITIPVHWV